MTSIIHAIEKAREVLATCNPDTMVPFPFDNIIKENPDISVVYGSTTRNGISGAILYDDNTQKYKILINSDEPEARQNFSLAHELGHYFLHQEELKKQGQNGFITTIYGYDSALLRESTAIESKQIETEANAFAAELLMPEQKVRQIVAETPNFTIEDYAKIFHVSVAAMAIRVERLDLIKHEPAN